MKHKLPLLLVDIRLNLALDVMFEFQHLNFLNQVADSLNPTVAKVINFEQLLFVGNFYIGIRTNKVDQEGGVLNVLNSKSRFRGHVGRKMGNFYR